MYKARQRAVFRVETGKGVWHSNLLQLPHVFVMKRCIMNGMVRIEARMSEGVCGHAVKETGIRLWRYMMTRAIIYGRVWAQVDRDNAPSMTRAGA